MAASVHNFSLLLLVLLCAAAALTDLRTGLIPDRLVLAGLALGLVLHAAIAPLLHGTPVLSALARVGLGALACALVPLVLYLAKGLGGGDLKLLTATGVLAGPLLGLELQLYAFALGGVFAFGYLAYRGELLKTLAAAAARLLPLPAALGGRRAAAMQPQLRFRFGPAIFAGALATALLHWRIA